MNVTKAAHTVTPALHQSGSAIVETLVGIGVFLSLGLGAWQWGLIYEAKSAASHAAFMGARAGSIDHAKTSSIVTAFARYMAPLYAPASGSDTDIATVIAQQTALEATEFTQVRILNPNREAFSDFGVDLDDDNQNNDLPNTDINFMSQEVSTNSGLNIQDANLLKIEITYGVPLKVPVMGSLFATVLKQFSNISPFKRILLENNRIPITVSSTVRMQTYAKLNSAMLSRTAGEAIVDDLMEENPYTPSDDTRPNIFIGDNTDGAGHNPGGGTGGTGCT